MHAKKSTEIDLDSPEAYVNRELSWLGFASRVLAMAENRSLPLMERIRFAGIVGMLHDEFFMKRISGLKRQTRHPKRSKKKSLDGRLPREELAACREEILEQQKRIEKLIQKDLRPSLEREGMPILDHEGLTDEQRAELREYFRTSVEPILTPLAVDPAHPFPFISNLGINLAVMVPEKGGKKRRFVRIKVPDNRPRWIRLSDGSGYCPLEQVIRANLDLVFPDTPPTSVSLFRVTRGAEGEPEPAGDMTEDEARNVPGSIVRMVTDELKARRFAGAVRLQTGARMARKRRGWLAEQLGLGEEDVYTAESLLGLCDLADFNPPNRVDLRFPAHEPVTHPRLKRIGNDDPSAIFHEIVRGDILLHHPYHSFDTSVLKFIQSAASDPSVLAIKLTIYRTSKGSPIVQALAEAARAGKQVAVLVEITARFDEAPNIAWGKFLEQEGVHVSYGVEQLKTHVKLALVIREERGSLRRYLHAGTGNYHSGTARIYEDMGVLTCDPDLCEDASTVFNVLTGAMPTRNYKRILVAPSTMRERFVEMIRREAEHAAQGRPCGIYGKMNQLQDQGIIRELYRASGAGVPIRLNVRGLCCLRPGVPGLSENIRLYSVVGRFLEHSRVYVFANGGAPEYYIGSADWMKRNLDRRVETIVPLLDPAVQEQLREILDLYQDDNASAWDCREDGTYARRSPADGDTPTAVQENLIRLADGNLWSRA